MRRFIFAAIFAGLVGCAQVASTSLPDQPVDASYIVRGGGSGPVLAVAAKVFEDNKMVAVCGAWAHSKFIDPYAGTFIDQYMSSSSLRFDDVTIVGSLTSFRKVGFDKKVGPTGPATCFRTDMPWKAGYSDLEPKFIPGTTQRIIWD